MLVPGGAPESLPLARLEDRVEVPTTTCDCERELELVRDPSELRDVEISEDEEPCDASLEDAPVLDWTDEVPLLVTAVIWL